MKIYISLFPATSFLPPTGNIFSKLVSATQSLTFPVWEYGGFTIQAPTERHSLCYNTIQERHHIMYSLGKLTTHSTCHPLKSLVGFGKSQLENDIEKRQHPL